MNKIKSHDVSIRKCDGSWAGRNEEKTEIFANYLENTFQHYTPTRLEEHVQDANKDGEIMELIKVVEVINIIDRHLNSKKALGYDLITVQISMQMSRTSIRKLTHLFNASLRFRFPPMHWKVAEVIMILKSPKERTLYRLICLLLIQYMGSPVF